MNANNNGLFRGHLAQPAYFIKVGSDKYEYIVMLRIKSQNPYRTKGVHRMTMPTFKVFIDYQRRHIGSLLYHMKVGSPIEVSYHIETWRGKSPYHAELSVDAISQPDSVDA